MKHKFLAVILIFSLLLGACAQQTVPAPAEPTPMEETPQVVATEIVSSDAGPVSIDQLKNATYSGIYDDPITLTDGLYEGEPFVEGDPSKPTVRYLDGGELFGDLDGDGIDDAVVFLLDNSGGSANILHIAAQLNQGGRPMDAGTVRLEEAQVKSLSLSNGRVDLEVITLGPGDGDCCGSYKASKSFAVQGGRLVETTGNTEMERLSAADLNGTFWVLAEINYDTPIAADAPVNIEFIDGQILGFGRCNNYNAGFTLGEDNPLTMTVSPIASTKMACPDPAGGQETTYLMALEGVSQWGYYFGRLALYYGDASGKLGRLLFDPGPVLEFAQSSEPTLTGQTWQWVSFTNPVESYGIESPENYTLMFNEDETVNITADCNLANGSYTDEDSSLQVQVGPITMAQCPPDSRSDDFIKYLGYAAIYFFKDGNLYIDLFADGGTMGFSPATR